MAQVFVSTTFHGRNRTTLAEVLAILEGLDLDGIELGSTHVWQPDLLAVAGAWPGRKLAHNYFPPAEPDLIINLASADAAIAAASLAHAQSCLQAAAAIGAELYTVHPGFLADATGAAAEANGATAYDFTFAAGRTPHAEAFARSLAALSSLAAEAARLKVGLAVETEGSTTHPGILLLERPEEVERLLAAIPGIGLTLNLAHSGFAALTHGFELGPFIAQFRRHVAAVEISHNDGRRDLHRALEAGSPMLDWLGHLPDVPLILEFRDATRADVARSIDLVRRTLEIPS